MQFEQMFSSIFRVEKNERGDFDVAFDVKTAEGNKTVRLSLVSYDRHAADTMAHMFNRVVNGVSAK